MRRRSRTQIGAPAIKQKVSERERKGGAAVPGKEIEENMDVEFKNFTKVWTSVTICLIYCYYVSSKLPKGILRLLSILPIIYLFTTLPFHLTTMHLGTVSFFFLVWLANFKLLLFSFDQGPLSSPPPPNILHFIFIASLPIKPKKDNDPLKSFQNPHRRPRFLALKLLVLVFLFYCYKYKHLMNFYVVLSLYCVHLYLELELVLATSATPVRFLGFEIEPQFNDPYLSTSLQDFWGRRWNLMVTGILRPTVYYPLRRISTHLVGPTFSFVPAFVATFAVSGLMHEIIYFHATRVSPTWEVTGFFVLHGVCVAIEVVVKKMVGDRWRLPPAVSGPLTVAFVAVTGFWLFFPQLTRHGTDDKTIGEYYSVVNFVGDKARKLISIDHGI